jgi:hypothetical protein
MDPAIPSQEVWLGYDLDVCRAKQVSLVLDSFGTVKKPWKPVIFTGNSMSYNLYKL